MQICSNNIEKLYNPDENIVIIIINAMFKIFADDCAGICTVILHGIHYDLFRRGKPYAEQRVS